MGARKHDRNEYCGKCRACADLDAFLRSGKGVGARRMHWPEPEQRSMVGCSWNAFADAMSMNRCFVLPKGQRREPAAGLSRQEAQFSGML